MTTTIPACRNCKHYHNTNVYDEVFTIDTCKFYGWEKVNYITGEVKQIYMLCGEARDSEKYCGHTGKNFEQSEVPVVIKKPSKWDHFKNFLRLIDF